MSNELPCKRTPILTLKMRRERRREDLHGCERLDRKENDIRGEKQLKRRDVRLTGPFKVCDCQCAGAEQKISLAANEPTIEMGQCAENLHR